MRPDMSAVRARGRLDVTALRRDGKTVRDDVYESGALRVRFPREHLQRLDATIVNVAGGMTGGDQFQMSFAVADGGSVFVSSAAAEKIYRSGGDEARIDVRLRVGEGATLIWAPQETIVFNQARLRRTLEADVADGASFLACEMTILGRAAMGEAMSGVSWRERWRIRHGGRLALAEDTLLEGDADAHLSRQAIGGGAHCFGTLVYVGDGAEALAGRMRECLAQLPCETGVSTFDSLVIARFAAHDGAALRAAVVAAVSALAHTPLPRGWHT